MTPNKPRKLDPFTEKRLTRFIEEYRKKSGQLPTLKDFEAVGLGKETVELAVKQEMIEQFYVTLTTGTILKCFKIKVRDLV